MQHIGQLYEAHATANADRRAGQAQFDALFERVHTLQASVERLTAIIEKARAKQKGQPSSSQPNPDQP